MHSEDDSDWISAPETVRSVNAQANKIFNRDLCDQVSGFRQDVKLSHHSVSAAASNRTFGINIVTLCTPSRSKLEHFERGVLDKWLYENPVVGEIYAAKEGPHAVVRTRAEKRAAPALSRLTDLLGHSDQRTQTVPENTYELAKGDPRLLRKRDDLLCPT